MNEPADVLYVPKVTGTHADVFAAVGLADLLASVPNMDPVRLIERETCFELRFPHRVGGIDGLSVPHAAGYPFLKANEKVAVPPKVRDVVDYRVEKAKADRNRQAKLKGKTNIVDPNTEQLIQQERLRDDWRLLQVLNLLQGDETSNRIHETIMSRAFHDFQKEAAVVLGTFAHGRRSNLGWKVSTVQLFTPTAAKGYGRLKPDGTDRNDKTKDQWADPAVEWMRYRGYFRVACPYFHGKKGEHVRVICPVPRDISITALDLISRRLRGSTIYGGPPKVDSLAVLKLAELLIRHSEEYHDSAIEVAPGVFLREQTPATAVSSVIITNYQSMGNAKAVSAMHSVALPDWFPIRSREDADTWLAILDDHQRVVRGLQDDHSDEIGLLIAYRRFLERRGQSAVWALVEFMEHYGPFVIRAREQGRQVRSFRTDHFRRIVVEPVQNLASILDDKGFQAVAAAVRQMTVTAQYWKGRSRKEPNIRYREIRYELLPDLRRKRAVPGTAFIETVSHYIDLFNTENAKQRERDEPEWPVPANVSTEEFSSFASLVDRYTASTVGALLCAYGSCREPRHDES